MNREPIAIIGIGCRFPKATSPEAFWHLLCDGVDAITEMPPSRWNLDPDTEKLDKTNTRWGGFLEQVDEFDPKFFGISLREAAIMDPQQRLLLEVTWEALEDAGQIPEYLGGTQTGVFIGIANQDFSVLAWGNSAEDIYTTTGTSHCIAANRISYIYNFTGPSIALDTACSSSLVAVHYACLSLWNQESTLAVAGGVNVLLSPKATVSFANAGFMAADGRCKTFDARADGYVRGEGAGVVILKPLSQALADCDRIYAVIKGSAVNQDGHSNGLTAPNPQAQSDVLRSAYQLSDISPGQVQYIEAHGTGTNLGDPIEMKALGKVLAEDRLGGNLCAVGSVKTNIGHLEAAAGIAGLIKVALSLKHRQIPPSLHFQQPNPYIPFDRLPLRVQQTLSPWPQGNRLALAGVSSFGFGGTNAHVVLAEAPPESQKFEAIERPVHLLSLSAKNEKALLEMAQRYQEFLLNHSEVSLADVCFTANTGRTHFDYRLAVVAESNEQLQKELSAFTAQGETTTVVSGQVKSKKCPLVAFLFTGQGSQYIGMGRQLYETAPIFRQTLDRCDEILRPYLEKSLLEVLYPESGETSLLDQTAYTQPALFAIEYALFQLWKSWGVVPTSVMGHSIGEYVAATVAGIFSLEDGLKLIAQRSRLMQSLPPDGVMVVVFAASEVIRSITEIDTNKVVFAALNAPENTVISGERQAVLSICTALEAEGIKTKNLRVSHAFHSPLMEPMLTEFHQIAASLTYAAPKIDLISNLTAERLTKKDITPEYWGRHLRSCVRFADSLKTLHALGYETFVEIGPKPTLLGMGRNCLPEEVGVWLPSLRQGQDDWQLLLQSLGKLYTCGVPVDWSSFDRDYGRELISLPTYPWQRQRYWIQTSEQRYQQAESLCGENIQSPITNLLDVGNTEGLARIVQKAGNFSPEQIKLLPELLSVLVREHKQHHVPDFMQDLCYEIVWREEGSIQQQSLGDYIPNPRQISDRLEPQAQQLMSQDNQLLYEEVLVQLEALSIAYVVTAFQEMGWSFQLGQHFCAREIVQQLGVINQLERLMHRILEMLVEVGILQCKDEQWHVVEVPQIQYPQSQIADLLSKYPDASAELTLLQRCGSNLAKVLRGELNPLDLLFPEGDLNTASGLYQDSPGAKVMNTLMQQTVLSVLKHLPPGGKLRVLEIGAGTGGTTSYLLPSFNAQQTEYVFTDLSPLFLAQAKQKFQDFSFVNYQLLDIEKDPELQGFEHHRYDLIVAANVLHATKDLQVTLQDVQKLLAPQGMLLLLEGTVKTRWLDLIFGLTDGWWRFSDLQLRPNYPLLTTNSWQKLLYDSGFKDVATIVPSYAGKVSQQAVILAQAAKPQETKTESGSWLIFADNQGIGEQLSQLLRLQQETCILVFPRTEYKQIAEQEFSINPSLPENFKQLLVERVVTDKTPLSGVVYLWSLDTISADALTVTDLEVASQTGCGGVLSLVQSLISKEFSQPPTLWLVTKGAQRVGVESTIVGVAQSPVWGLGKVITSEHPEFNCTLVDLDPVGNNNAQSLFAEICSRKPTSSETHIAFRNGQRYVNRLVRSDKIVKKSLHLKADATYLITGGLGGIGLLVAEWMVEHGAKHLVLVGRSKPDDAAQVTLRALEGTGTQVVVVQADVSQQEQVTSLLTKIKTSLPPLRGVIHAAGIYDARLLQEHQWEQFAKVFAPKVSGAWNLHTLTKDIPLDFFVLFSSAASIFSSSGLGSYAAANTFLDSLAHLRKLLGLPGLSINWGSWSTVGMIDVVGNRRFAQLIAQGVEPLQSQQVLEIMEQLVQKDTAQIAFVHINWSKFLEQFRLGGYPALIAELVPKVQKLELFEQKAAQLPQILDQLKTPSTEKHQSLLIIYLQEQIAKALGMSALGLNIDEPLNQMGVDSLMVIELRNRLRAELRVDIPITKFLDGVSVVGLTKFVSEQLFEVNSTSKASVTATTISSKKSKIRGEL